MNTLSSSADDPLAPVAFAHDGHVRPYWLHVPAGRPPDPAPLLVPLHGRGVSVAWFERIAGFVPLAERAGWIVAAPEAVDGLWNDGRNPARATTDDVAYVVAVIDDVASRAAVDPARVYVAGLSNGASMAGRLACERADRVTAIAQVAGTAAAEVAARCHPTIPVAVLQIHGTGDRFAPYAGGTRRGLRARIMLPRASGPAIGVEEWLASWVRWNGATAEPATGRLGGDTTVRRWRGPSPRADVVSYRVAGAGHSWPGAGASVPRILFGRTTRTFSASVVAMEFFAARSR